MYLALGSARWKQTVVRSLCNSKFMITWRNNEVTMDGFNFPSEWLHGDVVYDKTIPNGWGHRFPTPSFTFSYVRCNEYSIAWLLQRNFF